MFLVCPIRLLFRVCYTFEGETDMISLTPLNEHVTLRHTSFPGATLTRKHIEFESTNDMSEVEGKPGYHL